MQPKIFFAADHAGFALKNELVVFVQNVLGYEVVDCGASEYDAEDDFTDYVAKAVAEVHSSPDTVKAIILGGSGQGEAMLANRYHGVRATVYYGGNEEILTLSRVHNNANVLSLGARFLSVAEAKKAVALWLSTPHPSIEKYNRRNQEIEFFSTKQDSQMVESKPTLLPLSIAPSLPAQSFAEIAQLCEALEGVATQIQVDIVDGHFAPFISWPFTETNPVEALLKLSAYSDFEIEMDCMCLNPVMYLDTFVSLGVCRVIIHAGSTQKISECIDHAKKHGYKIGIGILNTTDDSVVASYASQIDFVQVMGIEKIGVQGQPFDPKTIATISQLRALYPTLEIAVDGAVNATTIVDLRNAGANRFAPGSAIAKSEDPKASYKQLSQQIGLI